MYTEIGGSNVPAFLTKLWRLVEDRNYNDLISWSTSGKSFIIRNQAKFAKELLPLYFKHNNMASFIRQLNMYGFRKLAHIENTGLKLENDEIEFYHSCFIKGQENLLEYIKRKNTLSVTNSKNSNTVEEKVNKEDVHCILTDVKGIKGKQETIDNLLVKIQCENEALWKEISTLRHKHQKQQQIVDRLIHFLVSLVQTGRIGLKRKLPLMIDNKNDHDHQSKHTTSSLKNSGPIIQEISQGFLNDQFLPSLPTIDSTIEEQNEMIQLDDQTIVPTVVTSTGNLINQDQINSDNLTIIENNKDQRMFDPLQESINAMNNDKDLSLIESNHILNENDLLNLNTSIPLENQIVTDSCNNVQDNNIIQIVNLPSEEASSNIENSTDDNLKLVIPSFSSSSPKNNLVPSTSSVLTTPNITMENFDNHIEGIDSELNNLQEQLLLGNLNIDSNVLMGLFFNEENQNSEKSNNEILEYNPKLLSENVPSTTDNNLIIYGDDKNITQANNDDQNINSNFNLLSDDPNKVTDSNYTTEILFDNDTDILNENF